ncbi:Ig-like domain-containing protein [Verminephrobacter eiseniae]|uniref:Ig-like domain-containing protein n=1 Tax=Verminephrobacter eiseniae TaxID=364317 RepID=UPI0022389D57|nr:Ig-like domain-containing protein [Verminephrobacter eiseniae]
MANVITVPDRSITIGETQRIAFDFENIDAMDVTGGNNSLKECLQLDYSHANGRIKDYSWHWTFGRWTGEFNANQGVESTGNYIRFVRAASGSVPAMDVISQTFDIDTKRPTIVGTTTIDAPSLTRAGQVTTITFTFHERITNFTLEDLAIQQPDRGTLENLRSTDDGRTWKVDLRAPANLAANTEVKDIRITIDMAGINDIPGNAGAVRSGGTEYHTLITYNIDTKPPSATIAVTPNPVTNNNDRLVTVIITFDEEVTGFTADNIDLSNANVGTRPGAGRTETLVRAIDGRRAYSITYTAAADTEDATNTISLRNLNTIRDAAGNVATVNPTSNNFEIDTRAPTVTIAMDKERLTAGETATVTFTFSETVTGFSDTSIVVDGANGTLGNLRQDTADGKIWRGTFTPTASLSNTRSQISVNYEGIRDRHGNSNSGTSTARSYTVDTAVFAIISATVNGRQLVLQYSDETALDPEQTHNAPNDAFVVLVDGVRNNVTGVLVDAAAKTITLTLDSAVTRGQQVSVAYNDPSTGDDPQAVQEATTGTDAASFAAKPATNVTPPPPPPHRIHRMHRMRQTHRTPTATVCPTTRRTRPPACCAPMARPAWLAMATATVSKTASRPPSVRPAARPWWLAARTAS